MLPIQKVFNVEIMVNYVLNTLTVEEYNIVEHYAALNDTFRTILGIIVDKFGKGCGISRRRVRRSMKRLYESSDMGGVPSDKIFTVK